MVRAKSGFQTFRRKERIFFERIIRDEKEGLPLWFDRINMNSRVRDANCVVPRASWLFRINGRYRV
jgi:hypothetical protein